MDCILFLTKVFMLSRNDLNMMCIKGTNVAFFYFIARKIRTQNCRGDREKGGYFLVIKIWINWGRGRVIDHYWIIWNHSLVSSAVIDCRNYRLSEYSRNDTTCRLLMAISIHKRHVKITASSYGQDVTLMLNGIKTRRQPGGKFVSDVNIAHG